MRIGSVYSSAIPGRLYEKLLLIRTAFEEEIYRSAIWRNASILQRTSEAHHYHAEQTSASPTVR